LAVIDCQTGMRQMIPRDAAAYYSAAVVRWLEMHGAVFV
jgi:hypothetical protein